ncbi:MAG: cytochrome c1 [Rhodothalassiaceae bacterium]
MRKLLVTLAVCGLSVAAMAAEKAAEPKDIDFSFEQPLGGWDMDSVQRGFQVYREVCSACHQLKYVAFRMLTDIGFSEDQVQALASEYQIETLDEYGDTTTRPGTPSDYFPSPFPNDVAAAAANNGRVPPNLSLIVEAREGGADYIYSLLTGYTEPPEGEEVEPGLYWNKYYPGHKIAMAQPLYDDFVVYADGTPATLEQTAKDVTAFLAWASEPNMVERKRLGFSTILFLIFLTALFYMSYKKVWAPVKAGATPWKDLVEKQRK